ncbi:tetratricopeptide repeat protein [Spirosoma montaniterrae]|uniref:histidine kinase n=1 Tax=Spirosoma montaniterrae TaxID=1178516 RepID=A0A1P9WRM3_9BACT|nr:tetratricopeptide repeat protein [Spirosoma montaniterrae]AQG78026.1 histidine kinase [Spirosoma montaniterrae]
MRLRLFLVVSILVCAGVSSLLAQPDAARNTVDRHLARAEQLTSSQPEQALTAAKTALTLAKRNHLALSEGKAYQLLTRIHAERSEYTRALEASKAGIAIFIKLGEHKETCKMYIGLGIINRYLKQYSASVEANVRAEKIAQEHGFSPQLAAIYGNLGNVYFDQEDYDRALQYHLKSLQINQTLGDEQGVGNTFHNLGMVYRIRKQYDKALEYYNRSLAVDLKNNDKRNIAISYLDLTRLFLEQKRFGEALPYAQKALTTARHFQAKHLEEQALSLLPIIHAALSNQEQALSFYELYNHLSDSLRSAELSKQIADMQARYQGEQKDRELSVQKLRLEAQQASLSQQRTLIVALIALALLSGLIGYLLFNRYKLRQRNKQLLLENEQYQLSRSLQLRQEVDETINYFATSLYGKNTVDEILWDVAKNCIARLGFVDCVIYLLNDDQTALIQKAAYGNKNPEAYAIFNPIEIPLGEGIVGSVARTGRPEIVADTTHDPRYVVDDEIRYSELAVPLLLQNKVIGVIDSEHPERGFFKEYHREALQTIAAICSSKIAQALADEEAKKAKILQIEAEYMRKLDQVKSQFFANISHEFRTPLQLILAPLQKREAISPEETHMMERNANRLLRLVNQLLDLAKAEMGMLTLNRQRGHLIRFLRQTAQYFQPMAASKQITYQIDLPDTEWVADFDRDKLEKIVYNLLSNAIKFTPAGGGVTLSANIEPATGLRLVVSDTGIGIPESLQTRIFDRFYQVDPSRTRTFEGSGLGLALTKELVDLCEGSINVASQPGLGTTFVVWLPLKGDVAQVADGLQVTMPAAFTGQPLHSDVAASESLAENQQTDVSQEDKPTLLLVEDHPELNDYLRQQLADRFRVVQAMRGDEGLQLARQVIPDLIISDVMMPVMDGFAMTRHLKEDDLTSHIPVILLTAKDDVDSRKEGFEGGAEQYLAKPFALDELVARINSLLTQRDVLRKKYSREVIMQPTGAPIRDREAEFLEKTIRIIDEHMADERFSVETLQREMGMSRMQLHRKLKALTNQSASDFIRYIRLQRAADLLKQPGIQITEAAYLSGFTHLSYFAKCFKEQFGVLPSEYVRQKEVKATDL